MSVLFVVVPLALLGSAAAVVAFIWAVNRGQLDDLTTPAHRMLEDDQTNRDDARLPGTADVQSEFEPAEKIAPIDV